MASRSSAAPVAAVVIAFFNLGVGTDRAALAFFDRDLKETRPAATQPAASQPAASQPAAGAPDADAQSERFDSRLVRPQIGDRSRVGRVCPLAQHPRRPTRGRSTE